MSDTSGLGTHSPHAVLRFFDGLLRILMWLLAFGTGLLVVLSVVGLVTGDVTTSLNARLEAPYTLQFDNGRSVAVRDNDLQYTGFEQDEPTYFSRAPKVSAPIDVDDDDLDTRVVTDIALGILLALTWIGLVNLRRVVRSARDGDPFDARNATRLRRLGFAVIGAGVTARVMTFVVDRTLDTPIPVHLTAISPGLVTLVVVGVALFALAECFRAGSELREFEQATV